MSGETERLIAFRAGIRKILLENGVEASAAWTEENLVDACKNLLKDKHAQPPVHEDVAAGDDSKTSVLFFGNGNTVVLRGGSQTPLLQKPWILQFVEFLESNGVDVSRCEFGMPGGGTAKLIKIPDGWNWEIDR